jgi:hypothetical protein
LAVIARQTRSAMLEVLGEDYRAHGPGQGAAAAPVIGLHALRNALIPVITTIGLQVGVLLAGAILTETIFSWPGIGKWMVDSISRRDYFVVQGGLLADRGHRHAGEPDRRRALRAHQPAHPEAEPRETEHDKPPNTALAKRPPETLKRKPSCARAMLPSSGIISRRTRAR